MKIVYATLLSLIYFATFPQGVLADIPDMHQNGQEAPNIIIGQHAAQDNLGADNFEHFAEQLNDLSCTTYAKELFSLLAGPLLISLAAYRICPTCIDALVPQNETSIIILGIGALVTTQVGMKLMKSTHPLKNTIAKGLIVLYKLLHPTATLSESVLSIIPQNDPAREGISRFISLITPEHLKTLPNPYYLIVISNNPLAFIAKHEMFIDAICRFDPERASERIEFIRATLEASTLVKDLPHAQAFGDFKNLLFDNVLWELPHKDLIEIACYRPQLLLRYPGFLKSAAEINIGKVSLITCFFEALSLADAQDKTREHYHY